MKKPFIVANVREVLNLYDNEEISFSRMVEMLNEIAEKFYTEKEVTVSQSITVKLEENEKPNNYNKISPDAAT